MAPGAKAFLSGRRAPFLLFMGLIVLLAYLAARLSWQFAAPPAIPAANGANQTSGRGPSASAVHHRVADITSAHLFGVSSRTATPQSIANVPKTSLDLTLLGTAAGPKDFPSQAIIASGGNQNQKTYAVGSALPGGAVIHDILSDKVVIAHDGRLESLVLPKAGTSILARNMHFGGGNQSSPHQTAQLPVSGQQRRLLERHPQRLLQFMHLHPYASHGHMEGYRVSPGRNSKLFRQSGLQPGDVITRVNGISLTNNNGAMQAMDQLRHAQGSVQLSILRHGKRMQLTVNLSGG